MSAALEAIVNGTVYFGPIHACFPSGWFSKLVAELIGADIPGRASNYGAKEAGGSPEVAFGSSSAATGKSGVRFRFLFRVCPALPRKIFRFFGN